MSISQKGFIWRKRAFLQVKKSIERDSVTSSEMDDRMVSEKCVDDLSKQLLVKAYRGCELQVFWLIDRGASSSYCDCM